MVLTATKQDKLENGRLQKLALLQLIPVPLSQYFV